MIGHALPSEAAKEGVTFGFLGQLKPTKGVEVLIQAFLSLADRSNYRLIIAGSGEPSYLQKLRELSGSDKRIELLGYTDPVEFFSRAQVVVIPSLWAEPLPRVGYEANFFGRPIIVSNRGGSAELIVAEENGSIFDPEDTGELSSQMTRWADRVSMSGRELAVACRDYALQRHHPEVVSAHYERVFADVLSKERV
jgi:glycosyltransferase involved in cell wall biosynthesis